MNCIGGRPPSDLCGRVLVVIDQPLIGNRLDQLKVGEQVRVEHLGPISSIEALDKGVLIWLARLDIADRYALYAITRSNFHRKPIWIPNFRPWSMRTVGQL